jgi:2-amino-4-hydroxy-6-hydroxymethyldihydropteridine diphosphokinase
MTYYLSLGSNLGDRGRNLRLASEALRSAGVKIMAESSVYETEPVDLMGQPWFYNQVLKVSSELEPEALLKLLKTVEAALGRVPGVPKGPRTIDIDILLAGGLIHRSEALVIPHPALELRNFVLVPLCEIAPAVIHPVSGKTIRALLAESKDGSKVARAGQADVKAAGKIDRGRRRPRMQRRAERR